ncbi:MAG: undecaprenyldiphospho-muramoylpentapeptide beta-N-acetylglucosaminyltransferase [Deltaproteobacteria bacterium]|jgi:UDP-N-acetylglucosamine--N-acetylmuramyl-(pentapeptide) pyrophosphoryl-undecaprenol N-acetylglucosamine transferase|nr:undecaprenyldiphospho-muramoylpentapeptide beta-N-acetylglucosaminyltransferase [Deltaproteobacteria bacterium]
MIKNQNIMIAAGGSGGHIFPALAVAQKLKEKKVKVVFVGVGNELEHKILNENGFELAVVPFVPLVGKGIRGFLKGIYLFPFSLWKAIRLIKQNNIQAIIGFGGFPSFIPMVAGFLYRIPRILHEQNVQVGVANKVLSLIVTKIFAVHYATGFWSKKKVNYISNPVRTEFEKIPDLKFTTEQNKFNILVIGGSQGAISVNSAILELVNDFQFNNVHLIHQTGKVDYGRVVGHYKKELYDDCEVFAFIDKILPFYEKAHLIICRAGAMTVAEVSASGRPAIFIPLNISKGHQHLNAQYLKSAGGCIILKQNQHLSSKLRKIVLDLIKNKSKLEVMGRNARIVSKTGDESAAEVLANTVLGEDGFCPVSSAFRSGF